MEQKVKIRDLAKGLDLTPIDITGVIKEYLDVEKKPTATLTVEEAGIVLENFSQTRQVSSFDEFLSMTAVEPPVAVAASKAGAAPKTAGEPPVARTSKTGAVKAGAAPKAQTNAKNKKEAPLKAGPNAKKGTAPMVGAAPGANKPKTAPANQTATVKKHSNQIEKFNRTVAGGTPNTGNVVSKQPAKPTGEKQAANQQKKPDIPKRPKIMPRQMEAVVDIRTLKVNEPPKSKAKGEAVKRGEQVTKRVDTRGSYVELDKYNERYEKIAPTTPGNERYRNDNYKKRQRNNQRGKGKGHHGRHFETEAQKLKRLELERARKQQLKVLIPDEIVVSELASRLKVTASDVIKKLFNLGIMAAINQVVDFDTATLVAEEFGALVEHEKIVTIEERLFEEIEDTAENLCPRSPVVVVMGHVDHGKTSLLDRIRNADVAGGEAGGITQHIGAYRVRAADSDGEITFLDTPGHEAFTSMRARGASITDIAIIVVAADDGIMPQTVEAIDHAKAAGVSVIIAINKIDKEGANPERVKQELTEQGIVIEEWGGDTVCVNVSAKKGIGIDNLLEMINLTADVMELKSNPHRFAVGTVIEAKLDKGRGPVATLLVQKGTLKSGDIIIAGTSVGRVRVMRNDHNKVIKEAGPSVPVEITGLAEVPSAGDNFAVVADEKLARELAEKRKHEAKEAQFKTYRKVTLDNLFKHIEDGSVKELPLIVKADVQGSVEAVKQSIEKLSSAEVRVRVIHGGVGAVNESDVMLANASNAIIIGFNVRPHPVAAQNAKRDNVDLRLYRVIYDAIEEVQTAMKGLLAPKFREIEIARIEIRNVFKITGAGVVAGCYVRDGKVNRNCQMRVVRDGIIVNVDKIDSLKRFKDDVKEVAHGYECGISLQNFSDFKEGDIFEAFIIEEYRE